MSGQKIVILHFAPLELYPPVQNLIIELSRLESRQPQVDVISTKPDSNVLPTFVVPSSNLNLLRVGRSGGGMSSLARYLNYIRFYSSSLLWLIFRRPARVMYFETISSWPAYFYKRYLSRKCEILVHYHEYTSKEEYQNGMTLNRHFHKLEKWLYPNLTWLSHTNLHRMEMFKNDVSLKIPEICKILPNHPPKAWYHEPRTEASLPLRIVYVGALGLDSMYLHEFSVWVQNQNGDVLWDIFTFNCSKEARQYLSNLDSPYIKLMNGISYSDIPNKLHGYDVGVVLYKGVIPNHIFSVSNKLYEYLILGLDVWFPREIKGSLDLVVTDTSPKVLAIDFAHLGEIHLLDKAQKSFPFWRPKFCCEVTLAPLLKALTK